MALRDNKRVVVFDWDGTLFDSMAYKRANVCQVFASFAGGNPERVLELHQQNSGLPRRLLFDRIARGLRGKALLEEEYSSLSKAYSESNRLSCLECKPFPDVPSALRNLRHADISLFVSSSAQPDELTLALEVSGLTTKFEGVFGSEAEFVKGGPHFEHIATLAHCTSVEMLFVGDDEQDERLGAVCGVETRRIIRGRSEQGEHMQSLLDLLPLLGIPSAAA